MNSGEKILKWYLKNKRELPWRKNLNPYRVWIAEVMLQQTTVAVVIPYYNKFLKKFPTLKSLAESSFEDVLPYWSGLGYYSRIRHLHQCAQIFFKEKRGRIPKTSQELIQYLGFGPYTSKSVSSIAYGEPVSVVDGNVVRVLCRHEGWLFDWKKEIKKIEKKADEWRKNLNSGDFNQALMELGATLCTPRSPLCLKCPVKRTCFAFENKRQHDFPLKKEKKKKEIWIWKPFVTVKNKKVLMVKNTYCPFLKGQIIFPGSIQKLKKTPPTYDLKHSITCHNIFIQLERKTSYAKTIQSLENKKWYPLNEIKKISPFSLTQKVLKFKTTLY